MSVSQPAMPPSDLGLALVSIMPFMGARNQAGEPFAAGPEDAASLVCANAPVAVSNTANAPAMPARYFISSPPRTGVFDYGVISNRAMARPDLRQSFPLLGASASLGSPIRLQIGAVNPAARYGAILAFDTDLDPFPRCRQDFDGGALLQGENHIGFG